MSDIDLIKRASERLASAPVPDSGRMVWWCDELGVIEAAVLETITKQLSEKPAVGTNRSSIDGSIG